VIPTDGKAGPRITTTFTHVRHFLHPWAGFAIRGNRVHRIAIGFL
jgi:hypothetical protein